jgi:multiple sugar transport system substrate-binding protein
LRHQRGSRRRALGFGAGLAALLASVSLAACGGSDAGEGSRTLSLFIFNEPSGVLETLASDCSEDADGAYEIEFEYLPSDADGQREQLVRRLGAEDDSIDIIGMDVIWTGEFANAGWLVPFPADVEKTVTEEVFPSVLDTAEFEGQLYGAPIWSNTQLLWYRSDLVDKAPKTWDEMIDEAERIGPEEGLIQIQANRYEGLTVWANQLIASAGGEIISGQDELSLEQEPTERALEVMGRLSTSDAADPSLTTSDEDTTRLAFESGTSAFMINYPFVYPSAEENAPDVFKVMKAAPYPRVDPDTPSAPPLGGINLGVSEFSENKDLAFQAIECLVKPENQITVASEAGLPPVREDIYDAKEIEKVYPGYSELIRSGIENAAARPSQSPAYVDLSLAIQRAVHPTTAIDPDDPSATYEELQDLLEQAINREGLL